MPPLANLLASIPSPGSNTINIGPLELRWYGVLIAIGVAFAFSITRKRYVGFGGDEETVDRLMLWAVGIGFLGARVAYVTTHTGRFFGENATLAPWEVIAIWTGGIALFGGLTFGAAAVIILGRRWKLDLPAFWDSVALALPVAQGVGRWGNYFNQELFGTPLDAPWALEIGARAAENAGFAGFTTFHPTFLYESLWNLAVVVPVLLVLDKRGLRRGSLILAYLSLYGVMRFLLELIRTDTTFRLLGLSRNGMVAAAVTVGGLVWYFNYTRGRWPTKASKVMEPTPTEPTAA